MSNLRKSSPLRYLLLPVYSPTWTRLVLRNIRDAKRSTLCCSCRSYCRRDRFRGAQANIQGKEAYTRARSPYPYTRLIRTQATEVLAPFIEQFTDGWSERWTPSEATKKTPVGGETFSYVGQWKVEDPETVLIEGKQGLVAKSKAAHHAISAPFNSPVDFSTKSLVVQYEVKYQKGGNCGGGYIKLLADGFQTSGKEFSDTTPWVVMFGPDLTCPGNKVGWLTLDWTRTHCRI